MFNRTRMMAILIILLLSLLSIGAVSASDNTSRATSISDSHNSEVYVGVNGSDENGDGTFDNPYQSLKSAINVAFNGSTIYMFKGTYTGTNNTGLVIDRTLIISAWNSTVTLDGENSHNFFDITTNGNLTLNGLKLTNGNDKDDFNEGKYSAGAIGNQGQLTIINSVLSGNTGFLAGAIVNYGNLTVLNSTFQSNSGTNYAGGITNFGVTNIQKSQFNDKSVALFNTGNMTVNLSNFISSGIRCDNFDNTKNTVTITNSSFSNAALTSKNNTIYIYNSSFNDLPSYVSSISLDSSNATIIGSSFGNPISNGVNSTLNIIHSVMSSYIATSDNSTLNITYSAILGAISPNVHSTVYADYNWWGTNKKPVFSYGNVTINRWVVLTFISDITPIPSKTNVNVTAVFKITDGVNIFDLNDLYFPSRYVSFETDNGVFSPLGGYMINNSYTTAYLNNTEDTWIYACVDNQKVRLVIGTGGSDYSIYVSNDGNDYYGDGSRDNPYKTLQKAVSKALNRNTIYLFAGVYDGLYNTDLYINKNLTFTSFNGDVSIYRYSNLNLFNITEFGQLNLNNINIYSSMSYDVLLIINNGVLILNNCTIANSTGVIGNGGVTEIYNSKFYNIIGSAIYANYLTIVNSSFTNISLLPYYSDNLEIIRAYNDLKIINSTFSNSYNTQSKYSRSFIRSYGNSMIVNSIFSNNKFDFNVIVSSGGLNSSSLISGSKFINNTGAVSAVTIENCTFVNNTGLCASASINNSLFINNTGNGPIVRKTSDGYISNSTFINNSNSRVIENGESYTNYGVIFNGGNLTVTQCTFLNNSAAYGGVIYNIGNLTVYYSVFVNNTAKYLGADIYNRMGTSYLSSNWWGSNSGPTGDMVYRFFGDVYVYNWVIMTFTANNKILKASLDKITDVNGTIHNLGGVLPSRGVFFDSAYVDILPNMTNLVDNYASATIVSSSDRDFGVYATIDNQTLDLTIRNTSTVIDVGDAIFYGKGNVYIIVLRNVNGYLITNQTLKVTITDKNGKSQQYTLITDSNGMASMVIDNVVGVYRVSVVYAGDGYFKGSQSNATIQILIAITRVISYNETFYGKENTFYATLYDVRGKGILGQKLIFNITRGNESKVYTSLTDEWGRAGVATNFTQGKYIVKVSYAGNNWYGSSSSTSTFTIYSTSTAITLMESVLYGRGNPYIVKLRDGKGNVIRNEIISLTISQGKLNQTFNIKTNENGIAGIMINLYPGIYNITAKYKGNSLYGPSSVNGNLTIKKVDVKLRADSAISDFKGIYNVIFTDIYDRPLVGESVNLKVINQKFTTMYTAVTDTNGIAHFLLLLDMGNYVVVSNFNENSWYGNTTTASVLIVSNNSANNFFIYNYLTNAQIQYILDNCKINSYVVFSSGQYDKLALKVNRPVNIRGNGVVTLLGDGKGTAFTINGNNVSIQGLVIRNYATGILNRANNVSIANNTFMGNVNGLVNYGNGTGVKINTNNIFQSNKGSAIYNYGKNLIFRNFKLTNNKIGITNKGLNVDIVYNTIYGGAYGVVNYASSADINYNLISKVSQIGIYNLGSTSRIKNNTLQNNNYAIYNTGKSSTISSNTITGGNRGIMNLASSVVVDKNVVKSVKSYGIVNMGSKNKFTSNTLTGLNKGYGIYIAKNTKSNVVQGNKVSKFSYGIFDAGVSDTIKSNTLSSNNIAIGVVTTAKTVQVVFNTITGGNRGIVNQGSSITISKNTIKSTKSYAIQNTRSKNKITSNTLTGINKGYGIYIAKNTKYNQIQSNTVTKFVYAIQNAGISSIIKSNTLKSNKIGINIPNTARNTQVTYNKISKNTNYGIYNKGKNTTLTHNQLTSNKTGIATIKSVKNTKNTIKTNKTNTTSIK